MDKQSIIATLKKPLTLKLAYAGLWLLGWMDWIAWHRFPEILYWIFFTPSLGLVYYEVKRIKPRGLLPFRAALSLSIFPVWHWLIFAFHALGMVSASVIVARVGLATVFFVGLIWAVWFVERKSRDYQRSRLQTGHTRDHLARPLGVVGPLESMNDSQAPPEKGAWIWNPLDLDAWFYGRKKQKLNQSTSTLASYAMLFMMCFFIITQLAGCKEIYEMPAGGGEQKALPQVVKVQKVIKKKFVINPFSAVLFNPPPIDEVPLLLKELTEHTYTVGYGEGKGAGFSGGTNRGKVRFIRLEYAGGDWDQDFGVGADLNLLIEYGVRTSHKVSEKTESRKVAQLKNFPKGKSPPMIYMTGQKNISLSKSEIKIMREYVMDKHGMIFADNGGSRHWHGQFFNMMRGVLPQVEPVRIPLDHPVHRAPYVIPFLPYVAPHGGKDAWGWVVDGRLAVYYHPGDIGDAWSDGHAGVRSDIWELCYQLGVNIMFYAHAEYNKWLDVQKKPE